MKYRNGFVSNSSSSSFIVNVKDVFNNKRFLSKDSEKILIDYGFKYTPGNLSEEIAYSSKEEDGWNLGFDVMCNEDEVIFWLLKNDISFKALQHYGYYTLFYESGMDFVLQTKNVGTILDGYLYGDGAFRGNKLESLFSDDWVGEDFGEVIKKVPVVYWLKDRTLEEEEDED